MKSMKNVFLCCQDPVLSTVITLYLSREKGITPRKITLPSRQAGQVPGDKGDVIILDTDGFEDPRSVTPVVTSLTDSGRKVVALCSITDPDFIPTHENLLRLEKPFDLECLTTGP